MVIDLLKHIFLRNVKCVGIQNPLSNLRIIYIITEFWYNPGHHIDVRCKASRSDRRLRSPSTPSKVEGLRTVSLSNGLPNGR